MQDKAFVAGAGVVVEGGTRQGSHRDIAEFRKASLLELLGEAGVDRFELSGVVAGKNDPTPDAVGSAGGHRVVAAAASKWAVCAAGDGAVLFAGIKKQLGVLAAR